MPFYSYKSSSNKNITKFKIFKTPQRKSKKKSTLSFIITSKTTNFRTILGLARKGKQSQRKLFLKIFLEKLPEI